MYVELPGEVEDDECGKLIHRLYGCRPEVQAWVEQDSALLMNHGFKQLKFVPLLTKPGTRVELCMGHSFVWEGRDEDLDWVLSVLDDKYELKNCGRLGVQPQ